MSSLNNRDYGKSVSSEVIGLGLFIGVAVLAWATYGLWWAGYWWAGLSTDDLGSRILDGDAPWVRESTILAVAVAATLLILALVIGLASRKVKGRRKKEDVAASHLATPDDLKHMTLKARRTEAKRLGGRYQA